jgi:hypothetical protein
MKLWRIILLTLILAICLTTTVFAQIPSVVNITVRGQNYQLIELIDHNNRWYRHEPEFWVYKQLDSTYPLTIYKADYKANKAFLKTLPDRRDYLTKHPQFRRILFVAEIGSLVLTVLSLVKI